MIHFDSWFGSTPHKGCQWPMKVYSSNFILPERETKKVQKMQSLLGFVSRCCFYFFQKWQLTIESLFGGICFYFFAGILRISKIGFIIFVHWFNRHFRFLGTVHCVCPLFSWHLCLSLGLCHPNKATRFPCRLCCAKKRKQMRSAEDTTGGWQGMRLGGPWIKSKVRPQDGAPTTRNKMEGPFPFNGRK